MRYYNLLNLYILLTLRKLYMPMNMKKEIIGREKEQKELRSWIDSDDSEFIAVYGRRRIGKTFLVRKLFGSDFAFYVTGLDNVTLQEQLLNFTVELRKFSGNDDLDVPENWLIAFVELSKYLEKLPKVRR